MSENEIENKDPARYGPRLLAANSVKRLLQVLHYVSEFLDANGESDQIVGYSKQSTLLSRNGGVGHDSPVTIVERQRRKKQSKENERKITATVGRRDNARVLRKRLHCTQ